jgi:hypothetical protein
MTAQKVNSLSDIQLPMQNCTTVQYFVVHAAHGVKAYQVSFPTQQPHVIWTSHDGVIAK